MKKLIALYIGIFLAGVVTAVLVSSLIVGRLVQLSPFLIMNDQNIHTEFMISQSVSTIELIESGDINEIYRLNCLILSSFKNQLEPGIYDHVPARKLEINELIAKAGRIEDRLKNQGYCEE